MIVQFQDQYFGGHYAGTKKESGYRVPDIASLAKAYSLEYIRIDSAALENKELMKKLLQGPGPMLIDILPDGRN